VNCCPGAAVTTLRREATGTLGAAAVAVAVGDGLTVAVGTVVVGVAATGVVAPGAGVVAAGAGVVAAGLVAVGVGVASSPQPRINRVAKAIKASIANERFLGLVKSGRTFVS